MDETNYAMRFATAALATWRLTHLLANEDGPADIIVRLRASLGNGLVGRLMDCFNCLSLWIAVPAAIYVSRESLAWVFNWLALSGAACLLESLPREVEDSHSALQVREGDAPCVVAKNERR